MGLALEGLRVIDADTHLTEAHDLWTKRAPAKYKDRVPHVVDVEVMGVIRSQYLLGRLDGTAAGQAVADLRDWPGERFGHRWLLERAWGLRDSVRGWDAVYVALAEAFDATLLTMDERLARAHGPTCRIEVPGIEK